MSTKRITRKGQAAVEAALMSLFLAMLLAAAVDFGRAYYIGAVVENMAGEGAAYAAKYPERDVASPSCGAPVETNNNIQDRARQVAIDRGTVMHHVNQASIQVEPAECVRRCSSTPIKVTVTYEVNDLFMPGMLGMKSITIRKSATQIILDDGKNTSCP
jgi:Flp pilus assembly protein TadG